MIDLKNILVGWKRIRFNFQIYAAETRIKLYTFKNYPPPPLGMDCLHFFEKRSFSFENDKEETKNETIVFKNDRFSY